jgi:hypothetical protein
MTRPSKSAATAMARTVALAAMLVTLTNLCSLFLDPRDHANQVVFTVDVGHGILALLVMLWLLRDPASKSVAACELAFAAITLPFLLGLWLPAIADLETGHLSEPLMPHHFLMIGIVIGAPTRRIGVAFLALFALHAIVLGQVLLTATSSATLAHEPWMTLLFSSLAGLLLYTRHRRRELEGRVAAAEERVRMLAEVARMLLALRDRANTPLQTIEIAIALIAEDSAPSEEIAVIERALVRLATVQQTLSRTGAELTSFADEVSISPVDLEQALRNLLPPLG